MNRRLAFWLRVPSVLLRAGAGVLQALDGAYREAVDMAMRELADEPMAMPDPLYVPDDALSPGDRASLLRQAVVPAAPQGSPLDFDDPGSVSLDDLATMAVPEK